MQKIYWSIEQRRAAANLAQAARASQASLTKVNQAMGGEFTQRIEQINRTIGDLMAKYGADAEERTAFMSKRFADGTAVGENYAFVMALDEIARDRSDDGAFYMGNGTDGQDLNKRIDDAIAMSHQSGRICQDRQPRRRTGAHDRGAEPAQRLGGALAIEMRCAATVVPCYRRHHDGPHKTVRVDEKTLHQRMVSELERFDAMPKELRRAYSECDYGFADAEDNALSRRCRAYRSHLRHQEPKRCRRVQRHHEDDVTWTICAIFNWFEGFSDNIGKAPTPTQWGKIKDRLSRLKKLSVRQQVNG